MNDTQHTRYKNSGQTNQKVYREPQKILPGAAEGNPAELLFKEASLHCHHVLKYEYIMSHSCQVRLNQAVDL